MPLIFLEDIIDYEKLLSAQNIQNCKMREYGHSEVLLVISLRVMVRCERFLRVNSKLLEITCILRRLEMKGYSSLRPPTLAQNDSYVCVVSSKPAINFSFKPVEICSQKAFLILENTTFTLAIWIWTRKRTA